MLVKFRRETLTLLLEAVFDHLMYGMAELQKLKNILPHTGANRGGAFGAEKDNHSAEGLRFAPFAADAEDIFSTERTGTDG